MSEIQRPWWDVVNPKAWVDDAASSMGIHGDNPYDPVVQARKAAQSNDIDTLEKISRNYTPGNFTDEAEKKTWEKQIREGREKQQADSERKAVEKLYGKLPDGKGVIEGLEERRSAMDAAARRQQFEHESGMNRENIQGQKELTGMQTGSNERIADMTSARSLEGQKIQGEYGLKQADLAGKYNIQGIGMQTQSNERITGMQTQSNERITGMQTGSNERIADMTSARQLQGIGVQTQSNERIAGMQDRTNRDLGFGDLKRRRAEALLNTYGQNKAGIQNFIVGAGQRSSFR